jgi:hypothetical protein
MKNKILFATITLLVLVLVTFTGCKKDDEFKEVAVTAVKTFYEPVANKYVILQPSGSMYFEWEKASAADNGVVYYDVLFDKADGDFSNPVYTVVADNKGLNNGATITHKLLNKIAKLAGIELAVDGKLKWTVRSNRGLTFAMAEGSRELTLVRLNSVDDLEGAKLFITGEGSEDGQQVKSLSASSYEIYTKLEANKAYYFYSELGGTKRTFTINPDAASFKETNTTPEGISVANTGTYRIKLDFESAAASVEKIDKLEIFVNWTSRRNEFTYKGKGIWELKDYNVILTSTSWGFDERYKIIFTVNGKEEHWGQIPSAFYDPRPAMNREGYRDMAPGAGTGQWDGKPFKFPNELCDGSDLDRYFTDITVSMTAGKNYTHDFSNIR